MADEFEEFELVSAPEQTGGDEFAEFEQVEPAPADAPVDSLDSLAQRIAALGPKFAEERARVQQQLQERLASADRAGSRLARVESQTSVARPFLRGAVDLADGALSLPKLAASLPVAAYNAATRSQVPLPISQSVADIDPRAREALAPQNDSERLASNITRGVGGALFGLGAGGALASGTGVAAGVGRTLAANPGLQLAGAVTGGTSAEVARQAGAGAVGQTVAGVLGGAAPSLALAGGSAATRGIFRGGEQGRQRVAQNVQTFERAGTTPSVGQATESRVNRAAESLLSRLPGGAGRVAKKAQSQADELATRIEQNAARLAGKTSAETTGRKISRAVTGSGGFVERTKATQESLYRQLDQQIPPATPSSVANTQTALKELTRVDPGAARTTASLVNPKIKQIADDLAADAQGGTVPYSAIKALRTRIGEQLDQGLVSDLPQKQLKRLYGALSEDLRQAATAAGPAAKKAFERANNYTRSRMGRLEVLDDVVQKAGGGEAIYKAATSGLADGATKLRAVMRSLDDEGQKALSATVLRRLGRAINSQQDELGDKFSTETFLTNWNKLSPEAKSTLFDRLGNQYRRDIESLSKVAANLRDGSQVFKNPSGTGQATVQQSTVASFALSVLTGRLDVASGIASGVAASNLSARLMTNPKFVRWLAVSTKLPKSALTSQINGLAQMAERNDDDELREAVLLLKEGGEPGVEQVERSRKQSNDQDGR